ncbi:MAG: DEAD/DEAH box helicase [Promethearchaeota archaeon]|nr:MAG: DEAD/DEAH box helicase [Candidatus Lokiarchaeota archaeon]
MNFKDLGISAQYVSALEKQDITNPTPVQKKAIPLILKGKHIMAQSRTGSGKTLAFVLPILEQIDSQYNVALILAPTRELAKQTQRVIRSLTGNKIKSMTIYGGVSISRQIKKLNEGVHIVVGTPGRIIDLYKRGKLKFHNIKFVVLDEGDRLWDMGFAPDIKYILSKIRTNYQFMLFSATLDYDMRKLVSKHTRNEFEFLNLSKDELTVGNTDQFYYMIDIYSQKLKSFLQILNYEKPEAAIIFINTKKTGNWLFNKLKQKNIGYKVGLISGNLSQHQREKILAQFRNKDIELLIATDVAARGLDIDNITHIFNYDVPKFTESYVHRIGRTSRMNKKGTAITLCLTDEYEFICRIEGLIEKEIRRKYLPRQQKRQNRFPFY